METVKKRLAKIGFTALTVVVVAAAVYVAYTVSPNVILNLFEDKIGGEEIRNLQYNYGQLAGLPAGDDVPLLTDREQFEEMDALEYFTFETDSIIPLPLYHLKSSKDAMVKNRKGQTIRQRPAFIQGGLLVENVYNRYYLVKLPDGEYVLSYLDDSYYIQYLLGGKVQLPLGRADYMLRNEEEYLASTIEEYGLGDRILDMFAEERYEERDFLNLAASVGLFVAILAVYILLYSLISWIFRKIRKA